MGLLDNISDAIVSKISKKETIRLPYSQLAGMVKDEFIVGADDDFLNQISKTAKGGGAFTVRKLLSKNERYLLYVGGWNRGWIFGISKMVYILDNELNKFYQMDKDRSWKKFYKTVDTDVKMEKINRNR